MNTLGVLFVDNQLTMKKHLLKTKRFVRFTKSKTTKQKRPVLKKTIKSLKS